MEIYTFDYSKRKERQINVQREKYLYGCKDTLRNAMQI
jgi:hypothetical protein